MSYLLTGLIHTVFNEESYPSADGQKIFRKRVLWVTEVGTQYPNTWSIEFWNDDGSWLNNYKTGMKVNVSISVLGKLRRKDGKDTVFNTLRAIKIQKVQ